MREVGGLRNFVSPQECISAAMNVSNVILKIIFVHNSLVTDYADMDMVIPNMCGKTSLYVKFLLDIWHS